MTLKPRFIPSQHSVPLLLIGFAMSIAGCKENSPSPKPKYQPEVPNTTVATDVDTGKSNTPANSTNDPTTVRFANAIFLKPGMDAEADDARMAPLLVWERVGKSSGDILATLGEPVESSGDTVILFEDRVEIGGALYERKAHIWTYSNAPTDQPLIGCVQTVLNRDASPVLWHVFDSHDAETNSLYVAQSIEHAAKREHGQPLEGRRFVVESLHEPSVIRVARLLEDGSEPMGPMVYISANPHKVAAVACRCMDSQVDEIEDARFYRLVRFTSRDESNASIIEQVQNYFESNGIVLDEQLRAFLECDLAEHLRLPSTL